MKPSLNPSFVCDVMSRLVIRGLSAITYSALVTAFVMALVFAGVATRAQAATYTVASLAELKTRITTAQPGDIILLKNGSYNNTSTLNITCAGTADAPITIAAETAGLVEITGAYGMTVKTPAAYVTITGFVFKVEAGQMFISNPAHHIRITRNVFACTAPAVIDPDASYHYLRITADDVEVDHNEFRDKAILGNMVSLYGPSASAQVARRAWIHHNYFHDVTPYLIGGVRANGGETIRYGVSGVSMSRGDGIIEYNLIERCTGDVEIISNKSCGNTYRYNTIIDCPTSSLTLRHGNNCNVYANIFRNTDGLRIYGDWHRVYSNYFQNNTTGIHIGSGDAEITEQTTGAGLTLHDAPFYCEISFNTLVSNTVSYKMLPSSTNPQLGAKHIIFSNNIILNSGTHVSLNGPYADPVWGNNYYWGAGNTTGMPSLVFAHIDPRLTPDARGIYRPAADSPTIGAATGMYSHVEYDMDGQIRYGACTLGADEPGNASAKTSCMLTPAAVGPAAYPPAVQGYSPALIIPRANVVITGSGFIAVTGVYFGSEPATDFTVDSITQITAIAPAVPPTTGVIGVTTINGVGTASTNFTAYTPPVNFTNLGGNGTTLAGHDIVLAASADGTPAPAYVWQMSTDGGDTWKNSTNDAHTTGVNTGTLTLLNVTAAMNSYQYRCVASNGYGDALYSYATTLDVINSAFSKPVGLAFAPAYDGALMTSPTLALYVSDTASHTVEKIHITGTMWVVYQSGFQMATGTAYMPETPIRNWWYTYSYALQPLAGATGQNGSANGTSDIARFNQPNALATDHGGNIYVADTGNATIRKITPSGEVSTIAGTPAQRASKDGQGASASFNAPTGIALAPDGNAYIADTTANTIRRMTPAAFVTTYAGANNQIGSIEATGTNARFNAPTRTLLDKDGNLYIADTGNHVLRTVAASGTILIWAGHVGVTGTTDGLLTQARFNQPSGMDIDSAGNLYIADTGNSTIRKIDADGHVTTLAGKPGTSGWADGDGVNALFDHPTDVVLDGYGNLYVADTGNGVVRVVDTYYNTHNVMTLHLTAITTGTTTGTTSGTTSGTTPGTTTPISPTTEGGGNSGGGGGAPTYWYFAAMSGLMLAALRRNRRY